MSKRSDLAKVELILKYISDIQKIIERHGSIDKALDDYEGEYALMMCLAQIGEAVNKISEPEILSKIPVSKISGMRNRIVHGYEDIDKIIIAEVLTVHLPDLKEKIKSYLRSLNDLS
jgi:uncharacterized protein with HEPN domain